jgi:transcriptional regulator with XRE-family HTH domain
MSEDTSNHASLEFSRRLESLLRAKNKTLSPTALSRDFNLRWRGSPVTVNAVRKWLTGEAVPTMDKLIVLASLLDTSEDWLRWGDNSLQNSLTNKLKQTGSRPSFADEDLNRDWMQDYRLLSPVNKKLLNAVLEVLLKEQKNLIKKN